MLAEECIRERRSVRKFSDREISEETLKEIVDLAKFAPSWKNSQAVRYHFVKNPQIKEAVGDNCVLGFAFNSKTISRCNVLAVVTVVEKISGYEADGSFSTPQGEHWQSFDAGIAAQTFCLSAFTKGVGSVILGIFDENKIREYVTIPENERPAALIALGYPLEAPKSAPPRKETEELVSFIR